MKKTIIKLIALVTILTMLPFNALAFGKNTVESVNNVQTSLQKSSVQSTVLPPAEIKTKDISDGTSGFLKKTIAPPDRSDKKIKPADEVSTTAASDILKVNSIMAGMDRTDAAAIAFYKTPATVGISSTDYAAISAQAKTIISGLTTDYDKVRAIYTWVASNIYYDYYALEYGSTTAYTADGAFNTKHAVCQGYAELTNCMLRAVGIPSKVISGYAKNDGFLTNADAATNYENHAWNEAYFDAGDGNGPKWQVIDTTWGSSNTYYYNDIDKSVTGPVYYGWFLPSANDFSLSHLTIENEGICNAAHGTVPDIYSSSDISNGTITIPDGTKYIGANAFKGLTGLTSIVLPSSVVGVASGAFEDCTNLKTVDFGSVEFLGYISFQCTGITSLNIPSATKYIVGGAFGTFNGISTITVCGTNPYFKSVNDVLYNRDMTSILLYPNGNTATTFTIPNTVTSIANDLFHSNSFLQTVIIGSGVKSIGDGAFEQMNSLTSIAIPDNVTDVGEDVFNDTESLKTATIGKNVNWISWCVFNDCFSLQSITVDPSNQYLKSVDGVLYYKGENTTYYEMVHFPAMIQKTTVTLPADFDSIGYDALCTVQTEMKSNPQSQVLQNFILAPGNTAFSVVNGIWYEADKTTVIMIPSKYQANATPVASTYTITYNLSSGTLSSAAATSYTGGSSYTLPTPARTNYTFAGWFNNSEFTGTPITAIKESDTGNKAYYAKWTADPYVVDFNDGARTLKSETIQQGNAVSSFLPTKAGYTFVGWYKDSAFANVFSFTTVINANTTIYARFEKNPTSPLSFKLAKVKAGQIKVSWSSVKGLTYVVEFSTKPTVGFTIISTASTANSFTKTGLKAGTTYYFRVRAYKIVNRVKVYSGYTAVKALKA